VAGSIVRDADRRLFHSREEIVGIRKKSRRWQSCLVDEDWTCARCGGVVLCMPWCESVNARVNYAHDAVRHPSHLSMGDRLILHALGVRWSARTAPPKRSKVREEPFYVSVEPEVKVSRRESREQASAQLLADELSGEPA